MTDAIQEDACHVRALGKSAYSIWRLLLSSYCAKTIKEISEATGTNASTVGANLIKLERVHLTSKEVALGEPVRWIGWQSTDGQLDEIAAGLGTKGQTY